MDVDQHNGYDSRYTFSAKELDDETQYSYFGARYYDSDLSVWLGVDPLADKYPSMSPYMYCAGNPVMLVDPDGMEIIIIGDEEYNTDVKADLYRLYHSGAAGRKLVTDAIKSNKKFIIADPAENTGFVVSENSNYSVFLYDRSKAHGTYDEANGGVKYTPETVLAHEIAHFLFDADGMLLNSAGQATDVSAEDVIAVEWENRVRKDMGLSERKKYGGVNVYGKHIVPSNYNHYYYMEPKQDYAGSVGGIPSIIIYLSIEPRGTYYWHGAYLDRMLSKPLPEKQARIYCK